MYVCVCLCIYVYIYMNKSANDFRFGIEGLFYVYTDPLVLWVECLLTAWDTGYHSQVESYQTQKMVPDATFFTTQHYKLWIKGKMEHSRERNSTLPSTSV